MNLLDKSILSTTIRTSNWQACLLLLLAGNALANDAGLNIIEYRNWTRSATTEPLRTLAPLLAGSSNLNSAHYAPSEWDMSHQGNVTVGDLSHSPDFLPSRSNDQDAIRVVVRSDEHYGTDSSSYLVSGIEEAFLSFCIRFDDTWVASTSGKLPGFSGNTSAQNGGQGGVPSNGYNAWSARMMFGPYDVARSAIPLGFYVYHAGYNSDYGDSEWWSPGPARLFSDATVAIRGVWHSIKHRIKLNSIGQADGELQAWFDGELVYSRTGLEYTHNPTFHEIYRLWLDVYHGGGQKAHYDQVVFFDQFNISTDTDLTSVQCDN